MSNCLVIRDFKVIPGFSFKVSVKAEAYFEWNLSYFNLNKLRVDEANLLQTPK